MTRPVWAFISTSCLTLSPALQLGFETRPLVRAVRSDPSYENVMSLLKSRFVACSVSLFRPVEGSFRVIAAQKTNWRPGALQLTLPFYFTLLSAKMIRKQRKFVVTCVMKLAFAIQLNQIGILKMRCSLRVTNLLFFRCLFSRRHVCVGAFFF